MKLTVFVSLLLLLSACSPAGNKLDMDLSSSGENVSGLNELRFVAIGDAGRGNAGQLEVANAIKNKCAKDGCDFVLMLGDNIYKTGVSSTTDSQFQTKFEEPYKAISIPFYMVLGNHDYGRSGFDVSKSIYQINYSKNSTKWKMPGPFYQFKVKNTNFFALDTNAQMYHQAKDQKKDVSRWIAQSNSTWKIAFGHHPYISNGRHGNAGHYDGRADTDVKNGKGIKDFSESVWCGKVDLYLSGHDHSRQWLDVDCKGTQLALSGAGATTTEIEGFNPGLFESDELGFLYISIDGKKLTAEFIDVNGVIDFTHTIDK